jgi:signal peptidase I
MNKRWLSKFSRNRGYALLSQSLPEEFLRIWDFFKFFGKLYIFFSLFFKTFVLRAEWVETGSMVPTCATNDYTIVSTIAFGFKLVNIGIPGFDWRLLEKYPILIEPKMVYQEPTYGDVVAFVDPTNRKAIYCKRIIACGGDRIQVLSGVVHINGKMCNLKYVGPYWYTENEKEYEGSLFKETLPNGLEHELIFKFNLGDGDWDYTEEMIVPKDHYFMMGDNRHNSLDSRAIIGFVHKNHILGRVIFRLLANGNAKSILNPFLFINSMNWNKCFQKII